MRLPGWFSRRIGGTRAGSPASPDLSSIPSGSNYASLFCVDPPIVLGWTGRRFRFGSASALAPLFRRRRITFLLIAKGSVADDDEARELAADAKAFIAAHPHHRFEWLCNIDEETSRLRELGLSAHTHNQNLFLREDVFRPLPRVAPVFDAIYNARVSPEKRNELAARLDSVAFVAYRDPGEHDAAAFHEACRALAERVPGGRLLNTPTRDGCRRLTPKEVNAAYARARVGLCLSPREGAMRVAVEYQLAGLPIVATPCRGGRDHFLDAETWAIVPPEPDAIRDAVSAFRARALPREWVRARTLARIAHARARFVEFVQGLIDSEGGQGAFDATFRAYHRKERFERWLPMRDFAAETWKRLGGD
ncbi:MAG: glycosyltransferase family 4 protein [Burkholderiales bacterium]|nr:glycosyltransferase family 4 protein [Burkholderiales bacterium]MCE7878420.1 glycosyltransferase [Betaproteobacteria bacterium PRO3]